ncbi:MAG: FtsX-like permease family protein [Sphingomonadales bacterium]|nr:FtsX-like permease family protein [Sphingomonadales bacterium]MDE2168419.1 FtsX-like permease family protein [Sphingomonadales bacterium]
MNTLPWSIAWRLARRDLSARFRGLRLLLACLFLGVGALSATGTLTATIDDSLATKGRQTLGGDVQLTLWQRDLSPQERAALARFGRISGGTRMQAMATGANSVAAPIELKAVDANWPLVGRLTLVGGREVGAPGPGGAYLSDGAAQRLGLSVGQPFNLAGQILTVQGIIADEPDRLSEGFSLGPTIITDAGFPHRAGLDGAGAMIRTRTRMACFHTCNAQAIADRLKAQFPSSGLDIRTRDNAAPGAENFLSRMGDFLNLVGLAALMIAGLGIGGGTASYLEARRQAIATLKVLGATSADIARIYVLQIAAAALVGSVAGLIVGTAMVPLLTHALSSLLPVEEGVVLSPLALGRAGVWGLLVALVFAAPPLAAARRWPAMALMRARVSGTGGMPRGAALPVVLGVVAIVALAFAGSTSLRTTALFIAGAVGAFAGLGALGWGIRRLAAHLPRPRHAILRMALANLHRPGAQTGRLVTALGFGLSAFVLLAVVQTSLDANIAQRVPQKAPDYFVVDLPPEQSGNFTAAVNATAPGAHIRTVPALRGAILAYGPSWHQVRVSDLAQIPDDAWALKGERGLTFSATVPEGNRVTQGSWWNSANAGEPQVSVDEKLAKAINLHIGDVITVGLLGVERSARITSFRRIDWDSFGFNYVLVFSPGALAGAPYKLAATISLAPDHRSAAVKSALLQRLTRTLPGTSVVEVGPLLSAARDLLGQVSTAILAAASIAVLAGIAVLVGAIAAARASRLYDNTILRVLGASRGQLLGLQMAEYGLLASILTVVALGLGSALGWLVVVKLFSFDFLPDWPRVLLVLGAGLAVVLGFAFASSLPLLRARPARALREL